VASVTGVVGRRRKRRLTLGAAAAWLLAVSIGCVGTSQTAPASVSPVPPTERSVAAGRLVYTQNCIVCHGLAGKGDGPAAASLRPPPADLSQRVTGRTAADLWRTVTDGVPGTAMPAWKHTLTDTERWDVVNYLIASFGAGTR
jgi:mono/diheme cytochrome c family protein